ncbi:MAG: radical SAM family heme chaperone HemW [Granulosicoccaceae bacterium]|jgi:oxygen-independent coproporphyrinogen-3 oxidase
MFQFSTLPALALYIHVPWCVRKCPYCDFNSHAVRGELPETAYIDALLHDLEQDLPRVWGRSVHSIFIGGGTPSLFSAEAYERLFSGLRARLTLAHDAEITLEANPGTLEAGRFAEYRAVGINRLSIGIQSFDDRQLQQLGRIHDRAAAIAAVEAAQLAGFDNFNLDLMFGLPGQDRAQALLDLETAIALAPAHLSHYQLTIEPNTLFHHAPPLLPVDDEIADIQLACEERLGAAGYVHYEISAHARPGRQCRHNLNYWQFGDYLGIGAGAHAKITDAAQQSITRIWKHKQPADYLQRVAAGSQIGGEQQLSRHDAIFEFMMNALRLRDGFTPALFQTHTGLSLSEASERLLEAEQRGLLEYSVERIRPTQRGRLFLNDLLGMFLEAS